MRLLIVEDEPSLARPLRQGLTEEGYAVDWVETVAEASEQVYAVSYDLVVLDMMLPDGTGLDLLDEWRRDERQFAVLVLTARDTVSDKVEGLDGGADDYLTKPFAFDELLARIRSLLRRPRLPKREIVELAELRFDRTRRVASVDGTEIELTAKEMALLEIFLLHPGRVLDRPTLADKAWDESYSAESNVIDVLVGRLRRKIEAAGGRRLIQTVKGVGYVAREPTPPDGDTA